MKTEANRANDRLHGLETSFFFPRGYIHFALNLASFISFRKIESLHRGI